MAEFVADGADSIQLGVAAVGGQLIGAGIGIYFRIVFSDVSKGWHTTYLDITISVFYIIATIIILKRS